MYADGGGLYPRVKSRAARSWIFRYSLKKRSREMGLGSLAMVTLADAREMAGKCRRQCLEGIDPVEARNADRSDRQSAAARAMTFDQCTAAYIASDSDGWRNAKHAAQWKSTLSKYASPVFGALPVHAVDVALVLKAVEPIGRRYPKRPDACAAGSRQSIGRGREGFVVANVAKLPDLLRRRRSKRRGEATEGQTDISAEARLAGDRSPHPPTSPTVKV
jgi:Arm DNA-binding domain